MKASMNKVAQAALTAAAMTLAASVSAQSAGQWAVKAGVGEIKPHVDSGDTTAPALPGTKADVGPGTQAIFSVAYGLTDHLTAELELGLPFRHKLYGAGAIAGTGQLASVKVLPPAALLQYRFFKPDALFRPYVGVGAAYAYFADETGSGQLTAITQTGSAPVTFSIKGKVAPTVQAGLAININARWFADFSYTKSRLKTVVSYSTGQTMDIRLDPSSVSMGIGYKF